MRFAWLVAWRYLRSPHKPPVLRLITLLSVLGVTAGVATLVIALSVNSGFRQALQDRLLGVTAHMNLTRTGSLGIRDYMQLRDALAAVPGVSSVTPALYQTVLLSSAGRARGIVLKGVDPTLELASNRALENIVLGAADFSPDSDGIEAIILGRRLAEEFQIVPGDYITLLSPTGRLTPFGMVPGSRRFRVTGVFDSGFFDTDANWGFVTLSSAQHLGGLDNVAGVLEFRLKDADKAPAIAQRLLALAGPEFAVRTWMEENQALFRALRLEKLVTAIFIGLITFVAGLNLLVVLAMTVTDKARDIAVLMSMGTCRAQVQGVFLTQGLMIGVFGTSLGLVLGYGLTWALEAGQWIHLDPEVYAISYVPFQANLSDAAWIALVALLISAASTFYPARSASRILPIEILRFE